MNRITPAMARAVLIGARDRAKKMGRDPSSNQATTLESQVIHMIQELFGQTLRLSVALLLAFSHANLSLG